MKRSIHDKVLHFFNENLVKLFNNHISCDLRDIHAVKAHKAAHSIMLLGLHIHC